MKRARNKYSSGTDSVPVDTPYDVQQRADLEVSDSAACKIVSKDTLDTVISSHETWTQLEQPLQSLSEENLFVDVPTETRVPSATNSHHHTQLDSDEEDIEDEQSCANCFCKPEARVLKRCTRCLMLSYCSGQCQRKNWKDHKMAYVLVAAQHQLVMGGSKLF